MNQLEDINKIFSIFTIIISLFAYRLIIYKYIRCANI